MLQTAAAPYVTPPVRDRTPPLLLSPCPGQPLHSASSTSYAIGTGALTGSSSSPSSSSSVAGLHGIEEHLIRLDRRHPTRHTDAAPASKTSTSSPASHLYGLSVSAAAAAARQHSIVSSTGRGSPAAGGLYRSPAVGLTTSFVGDAGHHHQSRAMTGPASPGYHHHHHHHPHVVGHGYMPFGGGSAPVDQGLFYTPSAVMAAALQHAESSETWRTALTQPSAPLWPYNTSNPGLYPYVGAAYVSIDSRRKNATRESTSTLKAWLYEHIKNPYPTKGEKIMLAIITKMTLTQVSTWFANARRRLKKENKMQWSTDGKPDDDDENNDDVDDDDDVIDVSNDDYKDVENDQRQQQQLKVAVGDAGRTDRQVSPPMTHFSVYDGVQKHIGSSSVDYSSRGSLHFDAGQRCYSVNSCTPNNVFHGADVRSSAFHLPPPPPPPPPSHQHHSLLSFMTSTSVSSPSSRDDATPLLGSPSADTAEHRRPFRPLAVAVDERIGHAADREVPTAVTNSTAHSDLDTSKSDSDRSTNHQQPCDVIKPRPRIWSLADVAMSAPTTLRRTNDDDAVADQRQTHRTTSPGGRGQGSVGCSLTGAAGVTSTTFQPWTRDRSPPPPPPTRSYPPRNLPSLNKSADEWIKVRSTGHVTVNDLGDIRRRENCSTERVSPSDRIDGVDNS